MYFWNMWKCHDVHNYFQIAANVWKYIKKKSNLILKNIPKKERKELPISSRELEIPSR